MTSNTDCTPGDPNPKLTIQPPIAGSSRAVPCRLEKEDLMSHRKLIRPSLTEVKEQMTARQMRRKPVPADQTNAENFYYVKQMQNRTPMVLVLGDGEEVRGVIEWYDKNSIKLNRVSQPGLLVLKHNIKYMYKADEHA
jgi:sRNA-binding regulator protein Hfq